MDLLSSHDVPVAPVVALDTLHEHAQVRANGSIDEFDHPYLGAVRQANPAVRLNDRRAGELRPAGKLGEHNVEVLIELGFDETEVQELSSSGVLATAPAPWRRADKQRS